MSKFEDIKDAVKDKLQFEDKEMPNDNMVRTRESGGVENPDMPDQGSTTGTTPNEEPVGRVSGQDAGYAGETGAERRAEAES